MTSKEALPKYVDKVGQIPSMGINCELGRLSNPWIPDDCCVLRFCRVISRALGVLSSLGKLKNLLAKHSSYASSVCGDMIYRIGFHLQNVHQIHCETLCHGTRDQKKRRITEIQKSRWILEGCSYSKVFEHLIQRTFSDSDRSLSVNGS